MPMNASKTLAAVAVLAAALAAPAATANPFTQDELPAVFTDRTLFLQYGEKGSIKDPETASKVRALVDKKKAELDAAYETAEDACLKKFLVEVCVNRHRKALFARERELLAVKVVAEEVLRADRTHRIEVTRKEIQEKRKPTPIDLKPPRLAEPKQPIELPHRAVREKPEPMQIAPGGLIKGATDKGTAEERLAREKANELAYARKQAAAAERRAKAEEEAARRMKERAEKEREINEHLKQRIEAQERYEKSAGETRSGLSRFFK